MLDLLPSFAPHVVAMRVSGLLDIKDLQRAIDAIEAKKKIYPRINVYTELDDMRWMTFTAFLRDLSYGLTQFGDLNRYFRAAVLSDRHWVRHLTQLESHILKPMQIRTFPTRQKALAVEWINQLPEMPDPRHEAVRPMD